MSYKQTSYTAKQVDTHGNAVYTDEENQIWHELIERQMPLIQGRACDEYINGMKLLNLPNDRIPQCHEVFAIAEFGKYELRAVFERRSVSDFYSADSNLGINKSLASKLYRRLHC